MLIKIVSAAMTILAKHGAIYGKRGEILSLPAIRVP